MSPQTVEINGRTVKLTAYNISDNNFFGIRELALFLGYSVYYDETQNAVVIETE